MKNAALGFRAHSGWTALVAVSLEKDKPQVLARHRPQLVATFSYKFRQPYHTAKQMAPAEAGSFLSQVQAEARRLACDAIRFMQADLEKRGYILRSSSLLLASGKALPSLDRILESHALIHTADGELFREALLHASKRCGLAAFTIKERELLDMASRVLRIKRDALTRRLAALGKPLGAPWSQDEKIAALAAWLALSPRKNS
jgi:hypothetical protein